MVQKFEGVRGDALEPGGAATISGDNGDVHSANPFGNSPFLINEEYDEGSKQPVATTRFEPYRPVLEDE